MMVYNDTTGIYGTQHGLFPKTFTKEHCGWPYAKMWVAKQQITDLLCMGVYETHHYRGFTVYIHMSNFSASRLVQHTLCIPFAVMWTLTMELEVV